MNIDYLELEHYKIFVTSTQQLNEALNNQLTVCYEKINQLFRELELSESHNIESQNQIQYLKDTIRQLEISKTHNNIIQKTDRGVYQKRNAENDDNPEAIINLKNNNRTKTFLNQQKKIEKLQEQLCKSPLEKQREDQKFQQQDLIEKSNYEISALLQQITFLKQSLQQAHHVVAQSDKQIQSLSLQILNWQQKCQWIQNFRIKNIHQMQIQKQTLLYQIAKRDETIMNLQQKINSFQNHQQTINYQQSQIQYLRQSLANIMTQQNTQKNLKQTNQHLQAKIIDLNQRIFELERQIDYLKNQQIINQDEQRAHRTTFLQIQLKMLKQQYTHAVKQNILIIEVNSKLQKKRIQLCRQLEIVKKQKADIQHSFDELSIENQHNSKLLLKKAKIIEDMNNKIAIKQNQNHHLKTTATLDLISKLQKSLNSPYRNRTQGLAFVDNTRKNHFKTPKDDQVPVRDLSRSNPKLIKSKSTLIGINFRSN